MKRIALIFLLLATSCCAEISTQQFPTTTSYQNRTDSNELLERGLALLRAGLLNQAEAAFYLSEQIQPSAAAFDGRGCVAFLRRDLLEAERLFKRAIATDPSYQAALGNLALVYEANGRLASARKLYEEAISRNPRDFRARNNLAALLYSSGNAPERFRAIDELTQASVLVNDRVVEDNLVKLR